MIDTNFLSKRIIHYQNCFYSPFSERELYDIKNSLAMVYLPLLAASSAAMPSKYSNRSILYSVSIHSVCARRISSYFRMRIKESPYVFFYKLLKAINKPTIFGVSRIPM